MDNWSFYNPTHIEFCPEGLDRASSGINYQRIALITTPGFTKRGVVTHMKRALGDRLATVCDTVQPNPDIDAIDNTAERLRHVDPDCLIGLGGGSSLDTAKALARILTQPEEATLSGHLRAGLSLENERALPVITIPTTAGTGAEVTPFATVWDFRERKKHSLTGNDLFPIKAILDPTLTLCLPESLTISSGLDAISHAFESVWNKNANPVSIGLATQSLAISLKTLPELKNRSHDRANRSAMMSASLLAGMAISQTRTALAHSISYPLTLGFDLPHGIACSFALPEILKYNAEVDDGRLKQLAQSLGHADTLVLADALNRLLLNLNVPRFFSTYGLKEEQILSLVHNMLTPGRADNNMRPANVSDVCTIVRDAFQCL
ncbi:MULTISPECIES: phosphonoacetaldehyde reductase [unclassified Methanoculleus]|uniref:phosphonoacetaldehyde reductase n=1 Tax=unclassified Methanoculleus TaxID=2619537 RepID=UPI0025FDF977|nr:MULTISPECIES: phosphonoacetaldehyde reductase [unclassified Methanoculleus]